MVEVKLLLLVLKYQNVVYGWDKKKDTEIEEKEKKKNISLY